jgi:hypothetical protein
MIMDTSMGITLCYLLHLSIERVAMRHEIDALKSGLYFSGEDKPTDDNIDYGVWALQLVVWCIIVLLVKLMLFIIQLYFAEPLEHFGELSLSPFESNPRMELLFVMVLLPLSLNSI